VLNALIASGASLSTFRRGLPPVLNTPELRFDCVEDRKFAVVEEVAARLRADGASVTETDGVRVNTEDSWWLLRASNTQAVLVARAEAHSPEGLQRLKSVLATQLAASGLAPDFSGSNEGH
jgi:phosphomannomutase